MATKRNRDGRASMVLIIKGGQAAPGCAAPTTASNLGHPMIANSKSLGLKSGIGLVVSNMVGAGVFIIFGFAARRGAAAGFAADPVPQALVITGVVVAFSATALATALVVRLASARAEAERDPPRADGA